MQGQGAKLFYVCGKDNYLFVACRNSCGFHTNLEPPKYFYPQAFEGKTCYRYKKWYLHIDSEY